MNILNKLTVKSLQMNKKRTIVTIIGIILSTALIAAVSTMVVSFRQTMVEHEKDTGGNYHYKFVDVPIDDIKYFKNNRNIENTYLIREDGYAYLEGSNNDYKPYLRLLEFDDLAIVNSSIKLIEGRMPQNNNEIVISKHIKTNGSVDFKIGQKLTLDICKRMAKDDEEEFELTPSNLYHSEAEYLDKMYTKKFEIVGIIERPNEDIEHRYCPGYTIITKFDNDSKENVYVYSLLTKKALKKQSEIISQIIDVDQTLFDDIYSENGNYSREKYILLNETKKYDFEKNSGLLRFENLEVNDSNMATIYGAATVVIIIIIVTSVFCIRNSFAISITEKMKQYGMLSSIGATPKQIKKNVLYEGAILALIGIPIGVLGGLLAVFILLKIMNMILFEYLNGIKFVFIISNIAILVAVILSIVTIYLSARASAKKASKVSPIDAIRGNNDINIKAKKLKSSKIIKKLFGIGGQIADKNIKRNKKKYRTTVISIVVSVAIFIAMSSFLTYAFDTSNIYYKSKSYNISIFGGDNDSYKDLKNICKMDGVEDSALYGTSEIRINSSNIKITEESKKDYYGSTSDGKDEYSIYVYALNDEQFRKYVSKLGLNYESCKNQIILSDYYTRFYESENEPGKYITKRIYDYQTGDTLTGRLYQGGQQENNETTEFKIAKVTDKKPMEIENLSMGGGIIIVDIDYYETLTDFLCYGTEMYVKATDADALQEEIEKTYGERYRVNNFDASMREDNAMKLVIAIFLYGFITVISLIGVTNIFNTITTNMNLRSREFAMLKSIGMTSKEFNRMIRLESILYGTKSLLIGVPIGVGLSYLIYKQFLNTLEMKYTLPILSIIVSVIAVFVLIGCIMKYSLNKINKQNIIETIRKDNI